MNATVDLPKELAAQRLLQVAPAKSVNFQRQELAACPDMTFADKQLAFVMNNWTSFPGEIRPAILLLERAAFAHDDDNCAHGVVLSLAPHPNKSNGTEHKTAPRLRHDLAWRIEFLVSRRQYQVLAVCPD